MRLRSIAAALMLIGALTVLAAGCGGDDEESTTSVPVTTDAGPTGPTGGTGDESAAGSTTVGMTEYSFDPAEFTVSSGDSIEVENDGEIVHNLTIEEAGVATSDIDAGGKEELVVDAEPGKYEFICTIANHAELGMVGTVTVE